VIKAQTNPVILDAMHKSPLFYPKVVLRAGILQKGSHSTIFLCVRDLVYAMMDPTEKKTRHTLHFLIN
jgi:hypothetical protein